MTYEIAVEHDGVRHLGDWCILMKELVVYYRGFTASCKVPSVNPEPVAKDLLREPVVEHYVPMHAVTSLKRLD